MQDDRRSNGRDATSRSDPFQSRAGSGRATLHRQRSGDAGTARNAAPVRAGITLMLSGSGTPVGFGGLATCHCSSPHGPHPLGLVLCLRETRSPCVNHRPGRACDHRLRTNHSSPRVISSLAPTLPCTGYASLHLGSPLSLITGARAGALPSDFPRFDADRTSINAGIVPLLSSNSEVGPDLLSVAAAHRCAVTFS